ncbi:hemerythrin/HHE cation-binding motif domain protein [mine drainage metagenome]|uniref:Hemerythrin/HHE cation-binding motif domain protein n=1 Tax=mine drainage metagenome TaxID=410659 RepID=T1AXV4_9ZZZZ
MASTFVQHAFILGLETEHAGLIRLLDKILGYMDDNNHERALDRIDGLNRLFILHCSREENEIYSVLKDRNAIDGLVEQIKYKRVPKNWQCAVTKKYKGK